MGVNLHWQRGNGRNEWRFLVHEGVRMFTCPGATPPGQVRTTHKTLNSTKASSSTTASMSTQSTPMSFSTPSRAVAPLSAVYSDGGAYGAAPCAFVPGAFGLWGGGDTHHSSPKPLFAPYRFASAPLQFSASQHAAAEGLLNLKHAVTAGEPCGAVIPSWDPSLSTASTLSLPSVASVCADVDNMILATPERVRPALSRV